METNNINKQYDFDFTSLNEFFNEWESPKQLAEELTKLILNYASLIDEDSVVAFKEDLCVVSTFCDELDKINPIDYENYVATQNK